jgi:hypothetical protein
MATQAFPAKVNIAQMISSVSETLHDVHEVLYSDVCNREPNFVNDNCEKTVNYFCANILKIPDMKNKVVIDRTHRNEETNIRRM